jgi:hypothetical protein
LVKASAAAYIIAATSSICGSLDISSIPVGSVLAYRQHGYHGCFACIVVWRRPPLSPTQQYRTMNL